MRLPARSVVLATCLAVSTALAARVAVTIWWPGAVTREQLDDYGVVPYHYQVGSMSFGGQGWMRPVYFSLLTSHTILAAGIVPLVLVTLSRALRSRFDRHVRIARWTLPLSLYVSVTSVIVYLMLYHLYGRA